MFKGLTLFVSFLCFVNFSFTQDTEPKSSLDVVEIRADNISKDNEGNYLIDIYAKHSQPIAGIQFEVLGKDYQVLAVGGGKAGDAGFNFYNGEKGIILAFSLEGKLVDPIQEGNEAIAPLLVLKIKKINPNPFEFNLQTLIAGKRGIKLESVFIPIMID